MALLKNFSRLGIYSKDLFSVSNRFNVGQIHNLTRQLSSTQYLRKEEPLEAVTILKGAKAKVGGSAGRNSEKVETELEVVDIDALQETDTFQIFPDETTPDTLYNGIKFSELPYVNIRMHKNNTKLIARTWDQKLIFSNTPSMHGFINAKKRTAVGGQVAGSMMGQKLRGYGHKYIRVRLNGFNLARESVLKGITQAGLVIVAIQDATTVHWDWPQRARRRPSGWKPPRL